MTMNAKLARSITIEDYMADSTTPTGPIESYVIDGDHRNGVLIRLRLFHPKSVDGRTVLLRLTEQDRDELLLVLRRRAVEARQAPA